MFDLKRIPNVVPRIMVGAMFSGAGAAKLLGLAPAPDVGAAGQAFLNSLDATGYFIPLLSLVQVVGGVLVVSGRFTALGLLVLAPIVVNMVAFHLFLAPGPQTGFAVACGMAMVLMARNQWWRFERLFASGAR